MPAEKRAAGVDSAVRLAGVNHGQIASLHGKVFGDDGGPTGGKRRHQLGLRFDDRLERAELLYVGGPDRGDDTEIGPREGAELGDLARPAHRQLEDADLGVGLEPSQRQRDADLVVETLLGGDRTCSRPADRTQDVLRRRLAHRAGDADDAGAAAVTEGSAERSERSEAVLGHHRRRRPARERVPDELRAGGVDGHEQVARLDAPRVDLHAGDLAGSGRGLEPAGAEAGDLVERERDHALAPSRRRASVATSRSSKGTVFPWAS